MLKLIKLELRKNSIMAYAPKIEPNDQDMQIFLGYNNLIPLFAALNMTVFSILSAVMYSKFIIEDYSGKRPILLFSYPISRIKILIAKLIVVYIFVITSMIVSNFIIFSLFAITEVFKPIMIEKFTAVLLFKTIKITVVMAFIAASIGIISVRLGFINKSVPTTIISALVIASLICNIVVSIASNIFVIYIIGFVVVMIGALISLSLIHKVNEMEVE